MAFASALVSRSLQTSAARLAVKHVTVIGGGLMGSGITQVAAQTGHSVTMVDVSSDILEKSQSNIHKSLTRVAKKKFSDDKDAAEKFVAETLARISINTDAIAVVKETDLVIEAIVENLEIKQKLFKSLDEVAPHRCTRTTRSLVGHSYLSMAKKVAELHRHQLLSHTHLSSRCFCTKSGDGSSTSDSSDSDSDSSSDSSDDEQSSKLANLAKPGALKKKLREQRIKAQHSEEQRDQDRQMGVELGLTEAVKDVAESLGGDTDQTQSDLLAQLREQAAPANETSTNLKDMFKGMKIQKKSWQSDRRGGPPRRSRENIDNSSILAREFLSENVSKLRDKQSSMTDIELFSGPSLDIFQPSHAVVEKKDTLYDKIEREEMKKLIDLPATNAFEEQLQWSEKRILWKFPVDNEHGMEHEQNVGFHEHVFLGHLLEDGFPKKGPVRHFMELVSVGLSKNPFISVQQKHEHINWYREYFKSKQTLIDELVITIDNKNEQDQSV